MSQKLKTQNLEPRCCQKPKCEKKLLNLKLDVAQGVTWPACCFLSSPISLPLIYKTGIMIIPKCIYGTEMR